MHDDSWNDRWARSLGRTGAGLLTALALGACGTTGPEDGVGNARAAVEKEGRCEVVPPFVPN
jgi:hypothetical protein